MTAKKTTSKTTPKTGKVFILDTSVILHDPGCIYNFEKNDVILPIHVLEKLDNLKKDPNYNQAIEFCRTLDNLTNDHIFNGGVSLGPKHGKLKVLLSVELDEKVKNNLGAQNTDAQTISLAKSLQKEFPNKKIIIVSKNPVSRLKAKSLSVIAQDYMFDRVSDIAFLSQDVEIRNVDSKTIDSMYLKASSFEYKMDKARHNQNFILKSDKQTALVRYTGNHVRIIHKDKMNFMGIKPLNTGQAFFFDALLDPNVEIITAEGLAGSGKTLLPVAFALHQLIREKEHKKIMYTRKTIEVGGYTMGFIPGGVDEKIDPYMQGMKDNLEIIFKECPKEKSAIELLQREKRFDTFATGYTRGITIPDAFIIIEEAQNLRPLEAKTLISRAGKGTKIILLGDNTQIDDPYLDKYSNGFTHTIKRFIERPEHVHIRLEECERSNLAKLAAELL